MTEKRFKMKKLEYEVYFIDSQQEYVDEDDPIFKIDGEKTMSDSQILDLLNENEQLKEDVKYFNETYSDQEYGLDIETHIQLSSSIPSREELLKENEQLKLEIKCIEELLRSYQKTVKHDAKLLADATTNGYLPPLEEWREVE